MKGIITFMAIIFTMMFFEPNTVFSQLKPNSISFSISSGMNFRANGTPLNGAPFDPSTGTIGGSVGTTFLNDILYASLEMIGKNAFVVPTSDGGEKIEKFSILEFGTGISVPEKKSKFFHGPIAGFNVGMASSNNFNGCFISGIFLQLNSNIKIKSKRYLVFYTRTSFKFLALQNTNFGSMIELGLALKLKNK
jgi:hypothetical protein